MNFTLGTRPIILGLVLAPVSTIMWASIPLPNHASGPAAAIATAHAAPDDLQESPQRRGPQGPMRGVYKAQVLPHWFADGTRFWYRNDLRDRQREFIVVDAEKGSRERAFDHEKLAAALSKAAGKEYPAHQLPFDAIEFTPDAKSIQFKIADTTWRCDLGSYSCVKVEPARKPQAPTEPPSQPPSEALTEFDLVESPWLSEQQAPQQRGGQNRFQAAPETPRRSPDRKWTAAVKDHNVFVTSEDGKEVQLSKDGTSGQSYGMLQWSPDSRALFACRIEPGERKEVYLLESSPQGGGRAKLHTRPYHLPGDKFAAYELNLFDIAGQKQLKPQVERVDFGTPRLRWQKDGHTFTYQKADRGHQRLRLIEVDALTGKSRTLVDEQTKTFIWTAHTETVNLAHFTWLEKTHEIIYASERDGWRHLYLIDIQAGKIANQITKGEYVVRGIDRVDEEKRQVWFRAMGKNQGQDPYFIHYYRINFDGTGLTGLTEGNGTHTVQYSPDRKYLIDTYSRVDMPPMHELRRVADGKLVCELEKADIAKLKAGGWEPPEVFVAKGRDGKTDIWGIICRPKNLDPSKKYPVIEQIYAGPQGSFVPKSFSAFNRFSTLMELGFIVVQMDGMGTANRSKAFHDVCWHTLKDAGFPDRILWHQAAAQRYAYYDITRVGIYGGSAGGQNSTGGVLFHPDFYKVAVSGCGCHDNRMDKASWNEQWMGYPVGPQYSASSNIDNAHRLQGKLLLIVGEMDTNVPPESTLRLADALIKAGKDFDLVVVPGAGHGMGGAYGTRRLQDFFVRHLKGVEPPNRNATKQVAAQEPQPYAAPDLSKLIAREHNPMKDVVARYESDLGSLGRLYTIQDSPARQARLTRFHAGWLTAIQKLDAGRMIPEAREECNRLQDKLQQELKQLEAHARIRAELAPLLPFAATIIDLEEARRRMDKMDALRAAGVLNDLKKKVGKARQAAEDARKATERPAGSSLTKTTATRAAESIARLRSTLKNWFGFYNSYDPLFTWWTAEPYKQADDALQSYATMLREHAAADKTTATAAAEAKPPATVVAHVAGAADIPDLNQILTASPSEMRAVIQQYRDDRGSQGGRFAGASVRLPTRPASPERQERSKKFQKDWLAALEKLDFDRLSLGGRVDYLLLRNHIQRELRRLEPPAPRTETVASLLPVKPASGESGGVPGTPIGRQALLTELAGEMIPYTPEELIRIAENEFKWCDAEMLKASREMGFGDDWRRAVEKVKTMHVEPGKQPELIRDLAREAIDYVTTNNLVTVPPIARETWRMEMMSPQRQLVNPFFTGGEVISVSFPTATMAHEAKLQSMRGNNIPFSRATVHHELIPGHHLQGFMNARYHSYRGMFSTSFWTEGWALYWEMVLYDKGFPRTPEDRVGFLFWRMHRCARIIFSLRFHMGQMTSKQCIDFLVDRVGHERDNATAEVRRSFAGSYGALYQAAYMLGGLQVRAMRRELVDTGKMSEREFHDAILKEGRIPFEMVRAILTKQPLTPDYASSWKFYGDVVARQ